MRSIRREFFQHFVSKMNSYLGADELGLVIVANHAFYIVHNEGTFSNIFDSASVNHVPYTLDISVLTLESETTGRFLILKN